MITDPAQLIVRARYTLMGDGAVTTTRTVRCPRRRATVLFDGCRSCEHRVAPTPGDDPESVVLCRGARLERPLEWPDRPAASQPWPRDWPRTAGWLRRSPEDVLVHQVMSPEVICVSEDVSAHSLMALLLNRDISGVPVIDERGRLTGVISKTDLVRDRYDRQGIEEIEHTTTAAYPILDAELGLHVAQPAMAPVGELMTPVPQVISETGTIARAAALMVYEGIHRLPVVSRDHAVVGILTAYDVLRWVAEGSRYVLPSRGRRHLRDGSRGLASRPWAESA